MPKDFNPLAAFADIKYEGTGIFQVQWLVDGMPFKSISQPLPFAKETIISSGEIPGLPTQIQGVHEVTLKIIQPQTEYSIPVIRYFVSAEREARETEKKKIDLSPLKISDLEGKEIPLSLDSIKAPAEGYFILNGSIKSKNDTPISFALLRVYLEKKLVDQQVIKDLKSNEEREFLTSIYNPSESPKRVYITLYNISAHPASLIFIKRINIVPQKMENK